MWFEAAHALIVFDDEYIHRVFYMLELCYVLERDTPVEWTPFFKDKRLIMLDDLDPGQPYIGGMVAHRDAVEPQLVPAAHGWA